MLGMHQHETAPSMPVDGSSLDRATFEREYTACIRDYLVGNLRMAEAKAVLKRSEKLTAAFAAVVGDAEAHRISTMLLERIGALLVRKPPVRV